MSAGVGAANGAVGGPVQALQLGERVTAALRGYLADRRSALAGMSPDLLPAADTIADFVLSAGKRLRPAFAYWGWRGAGRPDCPGAVTAAASLELLHACALIHDDVMDRSATRRGQPSVHQRFADQHRAAGGTDLPGAGGTDLPGAGGTDLPGAGGTDLPGAGGTDLPGAGGRRPDEWFGIAAAILLGDLCLSWSFEMLRGCGLDRAAVHRAMSVYDQMCTEVSAGQYLDVLAQAQRAPSVDTALQVIRLKTAKYTVERPLHLGGALAGCDPALTAAYTGYGLPVGEAFQLRDDVLGVFGDPEVTGKPAGDDLREGKRTVLVALAAERAGARQRAVLDRLLGDPELPPDGVEALRQVISSTGALAEVEQMIADRVAAGTAALASAPIDAAAGEALAELAVAATERRG
jgi:geranylgeranyl diphosphate synthase type I